MASGTLLCSKCKANEKRSSSNNTLLLLQRRSQYFHSEVLLRRLPTPPASEPALFLGDAANVWELLLFSVLLLVPQMGTAFTGCTFAPGSCLWLRWDLRDAEIAACCAELLSLLLP